MEKIKHQTISVNGINLHVAEIGEGPSAILFLHGFPELWYSWRHQMVYFASKGYRAIAPDLRGYGDSDAPPSPASYTALHIVGDLVGLLNALNLKDKVYLVGHDWGAKIAWYFCMFRPDLVKALVNLSVVHLPRNPSAKPVRMMRQALGDDFYMCRFQAVGEVEEEFGKVETAALIKGFLTSRDPRPPCIPKEIGFDKMLALVAAAELPSWLTQEDINYYATKFSNTGFTGGLNYYRALDLNWELTAPWTGSKIEVPVKFVVGEEDLAYHFPGTKDYIHKGGFKNEVPGLEEVIVMEGAAHFINQEKPEEISSHIYDFIRKF
ncbi:hypothetical protein M9H77_01698 [Catharanthus roseus]|uniref:Uncharacterized protein n=1 Tax=Catharanthus roseus TaxID=4058 RepID=A0ACC0C6Q1_CATRO|nr:hypothetical protein M9H77_01698 [Catharanthus roseus]